MLFLLEEKCLDRLNLLILLQGQSEEIIALIVVEMSVMVQIQFNLLKNKLSYGLTLKKFVCGNHILMTGFMNDLAFMYKICHINKSIVIGYLNFY
jgi:hypothetical protein